MVVGTPGLGYPLLLCRGKGLVVILDYVQTAGPLRSGVLFPRQRSRTCLTAVKGPGTPRVPEEAGAQHEQPGLRTSRGVRTPAEVPDPSLREEIDTPPRGGPEPPRVCKICPPGFHTKAHLPLHSLRQVDVRIDIAEAEAIH